MTSYPEPKAYPFSEPDRLDLYPQYQQLHEQKGLARVQFPYGAPGWLAFRYEDVKTVLGDSRFSRQKAGGPDEPRMFPFVRNQDSIINLDPPDHTRLRRVLAKAFTTRRIEQLRPRVQGIVDDLLDELDEHGSPADLVRAFAQPLPINVICELLGVPHEDRKRFRAWTDAIVSTEFGELTAEQIRKANEEPFVYLMELMAQRRTQPADDLLSVLVCADDAEDRLTEGEMVGLAIGVLVAGHETMVNQIGNFTYLLLTHPKLLQRLREQPEIILRAMEEMLRYVQLGVGEVFARVATEDIELGGTVVRAGEPVIPVTMAANHDASVFTEPDRMDFDRMNHSHLSFGHGVHHCLGAPLVRMELQVAFASLLRRFPDLRLGVPADDVPWRKGVLLRGPRELLVAW